MTLPVLSPLALVFAWMHVFLTNRSAIALLPMPLQHLFGLQRTGIPFFFIVGLDTLFVFKNCGFSGEPKAGPGSPTLVP